MLESRADAVKQEEDVQGIASGNHSKTAQKMAQRKKQTVKIGQLPPREELDAMALISRPGAVRAMFDASYDHVSTPTDCSRIVLQI
jgi:hypothetical protein